MKSDDYRVTPIAPENPKEIERQRDEYRSALIGVVVTLIACALSYWIYTTL